MPREDGLRRGVVQGFQHLKGPGIVIPHDSIDATLPAQVHHGAQSLQAPGTLLHIVAQENQCVVLTVACRAERSLQIPGLPMDITHNQDPASLGDTKLLYDGFHCITSLGKG